jgi:methylase of polypeptide subunit release factors
MENLLKSDIEPKSESKWIGKVLVGACGVAAIGISVVCFPFISPAFRKFTLPFIPATDNQLKNILSVLPRNKINNNRLLDIGSGDGRIVIATAKVRMDDFVNSNCHILFHSSEWISK